MSEYYDELYQRDDATRRAGWRHPLGQALRYEVALQMIHASSEPYALLDVGCGPGGLLSYLHDTARAPTRYLGLDRHAPAIAHARSRHPEAAFVREDIRDFTPPGAFDAALAIGALVTGAPVTSARDRERRIASFLDRLISLDCARGVLIVLDQDELEKRPGLALEGALFGLRGAEIDPLCGWLAGQHPGVLFEARRGFLLTDIAIAWRRPGQQASTGEGGEFSAHDAVIEGPWGEDVEREWIAWLWQEAGEWERAARVLDALEPTEWVENLRARHPK